MNTIMQGLRKQMSDKEDKIMTILHERAMLVVNQLQHKDRMELARDTSPTSADIKKRLAEKYGLTMDQLDVMIEAKPALLEEMDAVDVAQ